MENFSSLTRVKEHKRATKSVNKLLDPLLEYVCGLTMENKAGSSVSFTLLFPYLLLVRKWIL